MKCPHCEKQITGLGIAMRNLETYDAGNGSALVATGCCGKGVKLYSKVVFTVSKYEGKETEDDWGEKIKQG